MGATQREIQEWFEMGLNGGYDGEPGDYTHMLVTTDTYDWSDAPHYVRAGENPRDYKLNAMEKIMECYDLRLPMAPQLLEGRAHHYDMDCGLSDMSLAWRNLNGLAPAPPPHPVVMEADPEIEALLREEAEIEAAQVITPMMGEGWYRTYNNAVDAPNGPWATMADMAEALYLAQYPKDGYIVYATLKNEGGKFWMEVDTMDESDIAPEDLLPCPTWKNTVRVNGRSVSLQSLTGAAKMLGYDYFVWNGRVYATSSSDVIATVCFEDEVI